MYCYLWIYSGIGTSVIYAWLQVPKVTRLPLIETVIAIVEEMSKVPVPYERHVSPQHCVVCFCLARTSYETAVGVCVAPYCVPWWLHENDGGRPGGDGGGLKGRIRSSPFVWLAD